MSNWIRHDVWTRTGNEFSIEIERRFADDVPKTRNDGQNRWSIFVHITERHAYFPTFLDNSDLTQTAITNMPLHGGAKSFKYITDPETRESEITIECNYYGGDDSKLTFHETMADAIQQFHDANTIFDWLQALR